MNKHQLKKGIEQIKYVKEKFKETVGHYPDQTDLLIVMLGVVSNELLELNRGMDEVRAHLGDMSNSVSRAGSLHFRG